MGRALVTSVKVVEIRGQMRWPNGRLVRWNCEIGFCLTALLMVFRLGVALKPCAFGAPLRGFGA